MLLFRLRNRKIGPKCSSTDLWSEQTSIDNNRLHTQFLCDCFSNFWLHRIDIFENKPSRLCFRENAFVVIEQSRPWVGKTGLFTLSGKGLTRRTSNYQVNLSSKLGSIDFTYISEIQMIFIMMFVDLISI